MKHFLYLYQSLKDNSQKVNLFFGKQLLSHMKSEKKIETFIEI